MAYIVTFLGILLQVLFFAIIGRSIISWFDPAGRWPISRILIDITEPVIRPIRQLLPSTGMFDLSPLVATLLIWLLQYLLASIA